MKKFLVIGSPIQQSLSPKIHAQFARLLGIELDYQKLEVWPETLTDCLQASEKNGISGINVTSPLKTLVITFCSELTDLAKQAGAVNTLKSTPKGWLGHNTDGLGLLADLQIRHQVALAEKRILIIGAGGAVQGILPALMAVKPKQIILANRTPSKAQALANQFGSAGVSIVAESIDQLNQLSAVDLVINGSSAGHHADSRIDWPASIVHGRSVLYDLSYGKAAKASLRWASEIEISAFDGLGMLIEQAAAAFEFWHGVMPDTAPVWAQLRAEV